MPNPPPKEDSWTVLPIGAPFPPSSVQCMCEENMHVALWYEHGSPIFGRSWSNNGVVECSVTTNQQLGGHIQILQYLGDHNDQGFWYQWIQYKNRYEKLNDTHQLVHCGDVFPIFWKRVEGSLLGYVNSKTEEAWFSCDGKVIRQHGAQLDEMFVLIRNFIGGPPECPCDKCKADPPPPKKSRVAGNDR